MISEVLDLINEQLMGINPAEKIYGQAQTVHRISGSETDELPGIIGADGEIKYVGIDDVESIIIYHKLNAGSIIQQNNGRGDTVGDLQDTFSLSLITYWDRKKIKLMPDQMLLLIQARMPQEIRGIKDIKTIRIRPVNINLNTLQIFNTEYRSNIFRLPANIHLIQLNYNIETVFNPDCFRECPEC